MSFKSAFWVDKCPSHEELWTVGIGDETCNFISYTDGAYTLVPSRLFGLSYPDYLRMVRDKYNAILFGKNSRYATVAFKNNEDATRLWRELMTRWSYVKKKLGPDFWRQE